MDVKHFMKDHASQNIPLNFDEGYELGCCAIAGCQGDSLNQIQSLALLAALHNRATYLWEDTTPIHHGNGHFIPTNAAEQIAGICAAIFNEDIARSESGYLNPNVPFAMDNCGMGGDLTVTANVSTIAALIASTAGIHMCKHGSPANADKGQHGSSDFVSLLGIDTYANKAKVEKCVESECFGYTEALDTNYKQIHLQTHRFAYMPHMNDILGPITNPLNPSLMTRRVLGVNHLIAPEIVAKVYSIMNTHGITNLQHGLFVRGFTTPERTVGVDELSICIGGTQVTELIDGEIINYNLFAEDFGLEPVDVEHISPPAGISKGDFSIGIIQGEYNGPALAMVLANAALLMFLDDRSHDLKKCYKMAEEVFRSGLVYQKILSLKEKMPVLS